MRCTAAALAVLLYGCSRHNTPPYAEKTIGPTPRVIVAESSNAAINITAVEVSSRRRTLVKLEYGTGTVCKVQDATLLMALETRLGAPVEYGDGHSILFVVPTGTSLCGVSSSPANVKVWYEQH